jgi:hypothetical protein
MLIVSSTWENSLTGRQPAADLAGPATRENLIPHLSDGFAPRCQAISCYVVYSAALDRAQFLRIGAGAVRGPRSPCTPTDRSEGHLKDGNRTCF